jgi:hypothetical protein
MADGGIGSQSPATLFQARLFNTNIGSGVTNTLQLLQYNGNKVVVSGVTVVIPGGGVGLQRNVGDNLINGAGADAGSPGAASTLYYVYVSNSKSPFSPSSIRLSATAPQAVSGVLYLGAAGNALNWRFVGWVRTNATPQFESSDANRWIVNWYNRLSLSIMANPAYNDGAGEVTYALNTNPFVELNGGVGSRVNFIANGEDAVDLEGIYVLQSVSGTTAFLGLGIDDVTGPEQAADMGAAGDVNPSASTRYCQALAEGTHFAALLGTSEGTLVTVRAQLAKGDFGGAHDIRCTMIRGIIQG